MILKMAFEDGKERQYFSSFKAKILPYNRRTLPEGKIDINTYKITPGSSTMTV